MAAVPSSLVFLTDLPNLTVQKKVRFLGCVNRYDQQSGCLFLTHRYPGSAPHVVVRVNIDLVLETIQNIDLQYGAWINVMGSICNRPVSDPGTTFADDILVSPAPQEAYVKAVLIWNAGPLNVEDYEQSLQARKDHGTTG